LASWFFNRYGDQYFLSKIWLPFIRHRSRIDQVPLKCEVAAQSRVKPSATTVAIAK
jgi:hypothetical protein